MEELKNGYFIIDGSFIKIFLPHSKKFFYKNSNMFETYSLYEPIYDLDIVNTNTIELIIPDNIKSVFIIKNPKLKNISIPIHIKFISLDHHCMITNLNEIKDACDILYV